MNYGDNFLKVHTHIEKALKTKSTGGLVLLHGAPGTGKSTYIKHLAYIVPKKFLFIPTSIAPRIDTPSFISLLAENQNCVLVIEDAEKILTERESGYDSPVATVLNMTDGIVGDCLGTHIIATFNINGDEIDKALMRKGRLIAEHRFEALSIDDTRRLVDELKIDIEVTEPMTLAEIYGAQNEYYKATELEVPKTKIGF
jgi:ATP-dependent 26S proteasome regulatory subunit